MLKIKDNIDLKELEKFGFKIEKRETDYNRGTEWYYCKDLGDISYRIPIKRENWQWKCGFIPIRCIDIYTNDYDIFPEADDFDTIYDLIQEGLVEKVEGE